MTASHVPSAGSAPVPTNDYQRAIWDAVMADIAAQAATNAAEKAANKAAK